MEQEPEAKQEPKPSLNTFADKLLATLTTAGAGATVAGMAGPKEWGDLAERVGMPFVVFLFVLLLCRWALHNLIQPLVATHNKFVVKIEQTQVKQAQALESLAECQGIQSESLVRLTEQGERQEQVLRDLSGDMRNLACDMRETTRIMRRSGETAA